jgi:hypothetical protein
MRQKSETKIGPEISRFEIERWITDPEKGRPYIKFDRMATYKEILEAVSDHLARVPCTTYKEDGYTLYALMEYLSVRPFCHGNYETQIPRFKWLACWAVPGANEGYYIHVETIDNEGKRTLILLGKILVGPFDVALEIANEIAKFLYQER